MLDEFESGRVGAIRFANTAGINHAIPWLRDQLGVEFPWGECESARKRHRRGDAAG